MEGSVVVTKNEQFRFRILEEFRQGKISRKEAAILLNLSERTVQRQAKKVRQSGLLGIKHGNFKKSPANRFSDDKMREVLQLASELYYDFNMKHCLELLEARHDIKVSYATFHKWCRANNIGKKKRRRCSKARIYRERMSNEGLLLQMDGSHHKWNGSDDWVLIAMIDDATSEIPYAEFFRSEDTWNCMKVLQHVIEIKGIPEAIYVDKAGWFGGTKRQFFSQFTRACDELDIKVIYANSPEAKGRIERAWKTFQDRLIPELRVHGIRVLETANEYLLNSFLPEYWSRRNTVIARSSASRYRQVLQGQNLDKIFCMKYERTVRNDHTILIDADLYKLEGFIGSLKGKIVVLSRDRSGALEAHYGHLKLGLRKIKPPRRKWGSLKLRDVG